MPGLYEPRDGCDELHWRRGFGHDHVRPTRFAWMSVTGVQHERDATLLQQVANLDGAVSDTSNNVRINTFFAEHDRVAHVPATDRVPQDAATVAGMATSLARK